MPVWCSRAAERDSSWNRSICTGSIRPCSGRIFKATRPAERFLHGLVDDAHAAAADLAEDAVLAELLRSGGDRGTCPLGERSGLVAGGGLEALHQLQGGEELEDLVGPLGVLLGVLGGRGILAAPAAVEELVGQPLDRVAIRRRKTVVHGSSLGKSPGGIQNRLARTDECAFNRHPR